MKKSVYLLTSLVAAGFLLVGYCCPRCDGPRPYSDLATYKRIPMGTRTESLLKAGEDLFLRRRYEDAKSVFRMVLDMDSNNMDAKIWMSKVNNALDQEQNERNKKALFDKWGHLTPIDKIYQNWHWGPEVGHFEVRYSEPKPYVPAVRKFRPKATDKEIQEALQAYKKSATAENAFELAMRYWSQRKKTEAIKYYLEAVDLDPQILGNDDEYMLSMISEELEAKHEKGNLTADEYLTYGRLALLQGNQIDGINSVIKSSALDKKLKKTATKVLDDYVSKASVEELAGLPAEIYSFRQAYVFDKDKDSVYMRIILSPRNKNQLVPIDTTIPAMYTGDITIVSNKDVLFAFGKPVIGDSTRLYLVLPEKTGDFPEYEVKLIINLKRGQEEESGIELSNFSLPPEQDDNWSFIISSEFNNTEGQLPGNYEKIEKGVRVSGYHLGSSEGKGPYITFSKYKESLPKTANIWKIIENKEDEMSLF